ncbi:MAG TPA: DUF3365 domain-containing protein [Hyphomicrobiaceae bacterium]|nr:DUF3365 domain-containing protein [Hyphomicrobiaceae bacterium]
MARTATLLGVAAVLLAGLPVMAGKGGPADIARRLAKAREVATDAGDRLRSEVNQILRSSGPLAGIGACQAAMPSIVQSAAENSGFELTRTALKLRNPEHAPDAWELKTLELFVARIAAGADVGKLEHHEVVVTSEGERQFRYMKAIPMGEPCLTCHGPDIRQDVRLEIARTYHNDKAVGFKLGELRGAFSLSQFIDE